MTTPSAPRASTTPGAGESAQTHPCVRCGRPVPLHVALCEECNPLGLSDPAASQAHGMAVVGIIVFVVFLAVVAKVSLSGQGPFSGAVVDAVPAAAGLTLTIEVSNAGSRDGATNCVLTDPRGPIAGGVVRVQTPVVPAGGSVRFERHVDDFGTVPVVLAVQCTSP